ncbi:MAG: non-hydrolyzing UDP-N-acetylglucosamine 2-epimerase [Gulosibacter sp.]|uniref:non-hydrolyzing UDP-N-acetylglucosamine 2-epimerase n=1 Tax=Gulosibacter sp. TaxID=2817531 RepID=UPI003F900EF7
MRVVSIVGARPQFVKLAPMDRAFKRLGIEHKIIHTGQHYDANMSDSFFKDLDISAPDVHLGVGSGTHGKQTGAMLSQMDTTFEDLEPDWVLVYGDTNSTIAGALSAVKLQIPLAHLEAGLRSYNRAMPEEHNRVLTDHAADLCLAPTQTAMECLAGEGLAQRSRLVGDVMVDVCWQTRDLVRQKNEPIPGLTADETFVLATIHRAENTDDPKRLDNIIKALAGLKLPVVLPAHPRLVAKTREYGIELGGGSLRIVDPLSYPQMVRAIDASTGVVTDSGGLQKEAFLLQTPCTTLRTETEWVETLVDGWNVLDPNLTQVADVAVREAPTSEQDAPYGKGDAAITAARALMESYSAS